MTLGGWIMMVSAVGSVTGLLAWCLHKVFTTPGSEKHLHSQADIETPDIAKE